MSSDIRIQDRETARYASYLKAFYDGAVTDRASAENTVGPKFAELQRGAATVARSLLADCFHRRPAVPPEQLRVLEFGCGVGRMMRGFRECGVVNIDGVDISAKMVELAQATPDLSGSRFFVSSGDDLGDVPSGCYDLVYSVLVFQHLCNRFLRLKLLEQIQARLAENGVFIVNFQYYPHLNRETIPSPHAFWTDNKVARLSNSNADVFVTPDGLPHLLEDFRAFFDNITLRFKAMPNMDTLKQELTNYGGHGWEQLFVIGSRP